MKKIYEKPEMFTVILEDEDIVTVSLGTKEEESEEGDYDDIFGDNAF